MSEKQPLLGAGLPVGRVPAPRPSKFLLRLCRLGYVALAGLAIYAGTQGMYEDFSWTSSSNCPLECHVLLLFVSAMEYAAMTSRL
jgi:hypothetical protein